MTNSPTPPINIANQPINLPNPSSANSPEASATTTLPLTSSESPTILKTTSLGKRILANYTFKIIISIVAISFTAVLLSATAASALVSTCLIAGGILALGVATIASYKKIIHQVNLDSLISKSKSKTNTQENKWQWFNEILPKNSDSNKGSIALGALPLKTFDHQTLLKNYSHLSILEQWEMNTPSLLGDPLSLEDKKEIKLDHRNIQAKDALFVDAKKLENAVQFITEKVDSGHDVYVHCRTGRTRSAIAVACYLLATKTGDFTTSAISYVDKDNIEKDVNNAIAFLTSKRHQVELNKDASKENIIEFYTNYLLNNNTSSVNNADPVNNAASA